MPFPLLVLLPVGAAAAGAALIWKGRKRKGVPDILLQLRNIPQIAEAYRRNGGEVALGRPTSPAIGVKGGKGFIQPLTGSGGYPCAIFWKKDAPRAFVVRGGFYGLYTYLTTPKERKRIGIQVKAKDRSLATGGNEGWWPIEDEQTTAMTALGVGRGAASFKQTQRFQNGFQFAWYSATERLTARIGIATVYDSKPPKALRAWYQKSWGKIAIFMINPAAGVVALTMGDLKRGLDMAIAIGTDPAVLATVGLGVILAIPTGGSSLAAAAPLVVNAVALTAARQIASEIVKEAALAIGEATGNPNVAQITGAIGQGALGGPAGIQSAMTEFAGKKGLALIKAEGTAAMKQGQA